MIKAPEKITGPSHFLTTTAAADTSAPSFSNVPIAAHPAPTQKARIPNALWRYQRLAKAEPVMPVNEDFDQRVKNFDEKSGEDKRVAGRALIEKYGAKGIEHLGELFQTVLNHLSTSRKLSDES